jgi:X-Pro dipeptidyl-peptidase
MRPRTVISIGAMACLLAGVLVAPPAPASEGPYELKAQSHVVKTKYGRIYLESVVPVKDGKVVKAPAILTYSPYSILLGRNSDSAEWVPDGYARVWADVVGTGNSGGCWDYGGKREKETGYALVEWIADQKWSNGKVAMTGGSYNGTTAIATAVTDPPHLTTIVPEAAISRWYEYAYSGGMRYFWTNEPLGHQGPGSAADEGFDTPLAFDFGLAVPPPLDPGSEDWADRFESTIAPCEELQHSERGYDQTPDYNKFWLERDYIVDANKVDIPVLIAANWGDWNVKQEESVNFYRALKRSPKASLYMGSRWEGHGTPGGDYDKVKHAWMDHYLLGKDNGIQNLPDVVSLPSDNEGALKWYSGPWPRTKNVGLMAQNVPPTQQGAWPWMLLPSKPIPPGLVAPQPAQFISVGINSETHMNHHYRTNHDWFWFESPQLKRDVRIFGNPKVQLYSTVYRKWVTFTPTVVDVDHEKHVIVNGNHVTPTDPSALLSVTRGFLDSRYRDSLRKQKALKPGKPFEMTATLKPTDYVFRKGHQIGLQISTELIEWALPKPYPGCESSDQQCAWVRIEWEGGRTKLILPVVDAPKNAMSLFDFGHGHH